MPNKLTGKNIALATAKVVAMDSATRREACKAFPLFMTYYFSHYIKYPYADFHLDMMERLIELDEGKIRELAFIMFRESAKTSISKIYLTWLICYKKRNYINVDSYSKANAEQILFDVVLELQTNRLLKEDFGELYNESRDKDKVQRKKISDFITTNGVRVEAHSTQESVRGRLFGASRPDFLLLDDFETAKTAVSQAITDQIIAHMREFQTGLAGDAKVLYLGNYISEYGSVQMLLDRAKDDPGLVVMNVPVIKDGVPTWPAKYALTDDEANERNRDKKENKVISLEDKKRQLGSLTFNMEMMNMPIDEENAVFQKELFKYVPWEDVEKQRTSRFITIDTAMSETENADYTGITRNYVSTDNVWHIKSYRVRINPKELIDLLFKLYEEDQPDKIGIEKTIYLQAIKPFIDDEMRRRNKYFQIVPLMHQGTAKEARIRALLARYEAGSIKHIEGWTRDLEEELRTFPQGLHDDTADSLAYQAQVADIPYGRETKYDYDPDDDVYEPMYSDIGI